MSNKHKQITLIAANLFLVILSTAFINLAYTQISTSKYIDGIGWTMVGCSVATMLLIAWLIFTVRGCAWTKWGSTLFLMLYLGTIVWWSVWFYLYGD